MSTLAHAVLLSVFAVACAAPGLPPGAQHAPDDERAILATIDRFFEAMQRRDVQAYSDCVLADGMTFTQALKDGRWEFLRRSQSSLATALGAGKGEPTETYWQPTVLIRGPLAVVWTPCRFAVDDVETHRGVDVFDMVKLEGEWKIANALWTKEPGPDLQPARAEDVRPVSLR